MRRVVCPVGNLIAEFTELLLRPPVAALREDDFQMAFKYGAGVFEVLFGVGLSSGDALKCFVEDTDDPLLFGERGYGDCKFGETLSGKVGLSCAIFEQFDHLSAQIALEICQKVS